MEVKWQESDGVRKSFVMFLRFLDCDGDGKSLRGEGKFLRFLDCDGVGRSLTWIVPLFYSILTATHKQVRVT